jgi:tRNA dimethylallyltransferase
MKLVHAIVGPTGIGKSKLGLLLARTSGAEIINADSRQIYRYMDIGTAKPGTEERAAAPHHLIDIVDPDQDFSLALYQSLACATIEDIMQRGKLPVLIGGSGLYIWAILEGWNIPQVPPNPEFRSRMEQRASAEGVDALYSQLQSIDPVTAGRMNPRNLRRIIRALEIYEATSSPPSQVQGKTPPRFDTLIVGLTTARQSLYQMIDRRVDDMIRRGLVAEVKGLVDRGYGFDLPSMSSVGYRQIGRYIRGELDLSTAIQQIKFETHRFARHQYAWFRLTDPRIRWFDIQDNMEENVLRLVSDKLGQQ